MAIYTITLTDGQDAALDILIPRLNATLPEGATPYTKASYIQERAAGVAASYVAQIAAEEQAAVIAAYAAADAAKKASIKTSLGIS